jgi:PAS domain S-box-containing protein
MEEDLRVSEARYRSLFDNMLDGVVYVRLIFDKERVVDWLCLSVNSAYETLTGLKNVVGKRVSEIIPGIQETDPGAFETLGRVARTGVPEHFEYSSKGTGEWYSFSIYSQSPDEAVMVFDVITKRKQAEEALRASEANYRSLFESASDAIIVADAQGRYLDVNAAACRLFGATREELLNHSLHDLAAEEAPEYAPLIARLISGEVSKAECRSRHRNGSLFSCECSTTTLPDGRLLTIVRDITERKKAEEELRRPSGRLFTLEDDERRRLARELHDSTAQLLAALLMNLSIVSESIEVLNQRAEAALAESAALAQQCLREIRTLSYILHPPDLDELGLESALSRYIEGFTQRSGIGVELTLSAGLGRFPQAMETAVFRVVQECLTNIHRHSGSSTARLRLTRGPSNLVLEVEDAGQGIHDAAPSGVGIASMRERVRQVNGWLEVTSGHGGTIVTATIPL